jgi:hypothetical protein
MQAFKNFFSATGAVVACRASGFVQQRLARRRQKAAAREAGRYVFCFEQ